MQPPKHSRPTTLTTDSRRMGSSSHGLQRIGDWRPVAGRASPIGQAQTSYSAKQVGKLRVHVVSRSHITPHIAVYILLGDTAHVQPSGIRHLQGMNLQRA